MLANVLNNLNSHTLLVHVQNGTNGLETVWVIIKLSMHLPYDLSIPHLGHEKQKHMPTKRFVQEFL